MTREEIRKEMAVTLRDDMIIDKIYDDFESRTCGNCRFDCDAYICYKGIQRPLFSIINGFTNDPSFGCNKWEAKIVSTGTKEDK